MGVTQLGYIGIATSDVPAWLDTATNIIGMQVRDQAGDDGAQLLRMDEMHHRFAIYGGSENDVLYAGWQVESEPELERLAKAVTDAGCTVEQASDALCAQRKVQRMFQFRDVEGYLNEVYYRPDPDSEPFHSPLPIAGFNTGSLGLGHIVRHCKHYDAMVAFYRDVMGFRISDKIIWADADATFMRCNPRHHSLALINEALDHKGGQTNHIMVEMQSIDDVGRAYDEVKRRKLPIIMTLGRHSNDKAISFYFVGPSGFGVEIGFGGIEVDDADWTVQTFNSTRLWGHLLPHEQAEESSL